MQDLPSLYQIQQELHLVMENSPGKAASWWKWLAAGGGLLLAVFFGYRWLNPPYEPPVQPVPNAYNDLIVLGGQVARRTGFFGTVPDQELATIVSANASVLSKAREALRKESVVALDWEADEQWFANVHIKRFEVFRHMAYAFAAEGIQAQKKGNSHVAIQCGLDNLHLAQSMSRGGLGTDWLTGVAIYGIGLATLRETCSRGNGEDCRFVLNNLPIVSEFFDPPDDITVREWHFWRRINGPYQTFLTELTFSNNRAQFERDLEGTVTLYQAMTDLLRLHYALRAFQLVESRLPKSLQDLEGRELNTIPLDPYSGKDFIYLPGKDRYILYSIGPNGVDDGGLVNNQDREQGDLVLEPYTPGIDSPLQK
jgi:hypothetical protein